jgi:DNA-binding transcriptional ArsR family regulator
MITASLTQEITQLHANICSGLADPRRILILYALYERSYNVGELAVELNISQPATSRHLMILRERGMVTAQRDGQAVIYQLADERVIQALELLRGMLADKLKNQAVLANSVYDSLDLLVSE